MEPKEPKETSETARLKNQIKKLEAELSEVRKDRDEGNAALLRQWRVMTDLRYKLRLAEETIQYMRAALSALGVEEAAAAQAEGYTRTKRGRPSRIDSGTHDRIRQLHTDGMSVREISRREGVSVGMISKILNE